MCFVSGETAEPLQETTELIEDIVRGQVIEMLVAANALASKRASKTISAEDLMFLIRHDRAKVSRLRLYLGWKDVRKNAKDQGEGAADGTELLDDAVAGEAAKVKHKRAKLGLPWEVSQMFSEKVPEKEDDEDEEEMEANQATLQRLKNADERTRAMTKEEYVHWSECRQASFTYKKAKRFREWANVASLTDSRPNDEIIDILGFLTFEIVATITEESLKVKANERGPQIIPGSIGAKKRKNGCDLFQTSETSVTPLKARHIAEAFRRMQVPKDRCRVMRNFRGGLLRTRLQLI